MPPERLHCCGRYRQIPAAEIVPLNRSRQAVRDHDRGMQRWFLKRDCFLAERREGREQEHGQKQGDRELRHFSPGFGITRNHRKGEMPKGTGRVYP